MQVPQAAPEPALPEAASRQTRLPAYLGLDFRPREKRDRAQVTTREDAPTYSVAHTTIARLSTAEARLPGAPSG